MLSPTAINAAMVPLYWTRPWASRGSPWSAAPTAVPTDPCLLGYTPMCHH